MKKADHYFMRGVAPIGTASSLLVSSSKYLNNPRLRDWVAMVSLRRNGPDYPAAAELVELFDILDEIRDPERVEHLFTEERRSNPPVDAWLNEAYMSPRMTLEDYAQYPAGSVGEILYRQLADKYEVEFTNDHWEAATSQWDYYWRREAQTHDLEHVLLGGTVDALGELVASYFRMENIPRFFRNEELVGELLAHKIFASTRYVTRTMLHYPSVWSYCADAISRGIVAGRSSDPIFMKRLEPVLGLPLKEARRRLGIRNAVDRDTSAASAYWSEEAEIPPPMLEQEDMTEPVLW
ncbi:MAG: hypothetical protein KDA53_14240 [Hyphomonas sp.]|nr:hypothetical protein [Hyphomonas sp.]